jgi:hypothetical protein
LTPPRVIQLDPAIAEYAGTVDEIQGRAVQLASATGKFAADRAGFLARGDMLRARFVGQVLDKLRRSVYFRDGDEWRIALDGVVEITRWREGML